MVLAALRVAAVVVLLVAMVALIAFFPTNNHRLLTGGIIGVLVGGAALTAIHQSEGRRETQ